MITRHRANQYARDHLNDDVITYGSRDRGYAYELSPRLKTPTSPDDYVLGPGPYIILKDTGALYSFGSNEVDMEIVLSPTKGIFLEKIAQYNIRSVDTLHE